jgi:hypothetical protein
MDEIGIETPRNVGILLYYILVLIASIGVP